MDQRPVSYKTLRLPAAGSYSESGSKFLAYAFPAAAEEEIRAYRDRLQKEHHKAVHIAMGARYGYDDLLEKFSDDGEPSGTAGRPVLNALKSHEITNAGILVVRYFGGKKLGVPGLINAYRTAAENALAQADIVVVQIKEHYTATCGEAEMPLVMHEINRSGARIIDSTFGELCTFKIVFDRASLSSILPKLQAIWQMQLVYSGSE